MDCYQNSLNFKDSFHSLRHFFSIEINNSVKCELQQSQSLKLFLQPNLLGMEVCDKTCLFLFSINWNLFPLAYTFYNCMWLHVAILFD